MKFNNYRFTIAVWSAFLMLTAVSCHDPFFDRTEPAPGQAVNEGIREQFTDGITITLGYETHSLKAPILRTAGQSIDISKESELRLDGTRVLIFDNSGNYLYDAPVIKINRSVSQNNTGKITILGKEGKNLSLVVLTNLTKAEKVRKVNVGTTKAEVLKSFTFDITDQTDFDEVGLPMWGELPQLDIAHDKPNPTVGTIHLLRSVARVDVGLMMSRKGTSGTDADFDEHSFDLESTIVDPTSGTTKTVKWSLNKVYFFNAAGKGLVAPTSGKYGLDAGVPTAKEVSLPTSPGNQNIIYTASDNLLKRVIYVPETDNPEPAASVGDQTNPGNEQVYMSRPYIVVEMTYTVAGSPTVSKPTFFRIDFLKRDNEEATAEYTYLPLLRNHRYKVDIRNIGGLGFDKLEDAKKGPSANIMYNVLVWDDSHMSDVVYDGQYMLGVQQDKFTAYKNGGTLTTTVQTTWPDGFEVKGLPNNGWVRANKLKFPGTDKQTVTFTFDKNNTDQERVYEDAYIQAGRMRWNLKFTQTNTMDVRIEIFSDPECTQPLQYIELDERGKDTPSEAITIGTKTFYIRVSNNGKITGVRGSTGDKFLFSTGTDHYEESLPSIYGIGKLSSGVYVYTVTADPMINEDDPFEYKQDKFTFITEQDGKQAQAELTINQTEYNICFYEDAQLKNRITENSGVYFMDGKEHSYYVKSNIPYTIWLDNQSIDESAITKYNADADGFSLEPMVVSYYDDMGIKQDIDYQIGVWRPVKQQDIPSRAGSILRFNVANDLQNPTIIYGHVKWVAGTSLESLDWKFPMYNGHNKDKVKMITSDFLSALILPESNSYPITLGRAGVLIPLSRINHAAEFYEENVDAPAGFTEDNYYPVDKTTTGKQAGESWVSYKKRNALNTLDDDDRISLEVIWTDIKSVTEAPADQRNPINKNGTAPLKMLVPVSAGGQRYAFLLPGNDFDENYGNLVFGVRSSIKERVNNFRPTDLDPEQSGKKALLWSFHIMLYQNGQIPLDQGDISSDKALIYYDKSYDSDYNTLWSWNVISWPYDLGAFGGPSLSSDKYTGGHVDIDYRHIGLSYQFGRKDPFPRWKQVKNAPSRFVGHEGKDADFRYIKGITISMRESIENPMLLVASYAGHQWLTEGGREVGGGAIKDVGVDGAMAFGFYGLWGGGSATEVTKHSELRRITKKTVFDPCPYGFSVPTPGYNFTTAILGSSENRKRFNANLVVCVPRITNPKFVNTYFDDGFSIFSVFGNLRGDSGTAGPAGYAFWAISTAYLGPELYPVIGIGMVSDKAAQTFATEDVHRSSPILVRPFLDHGVKDDWMQYIRMQNGTRRFSLGQ